MFKKKDDEYYLNNGRECQKKEKYEEAIKYYNKATEINQNCWKAYNNIGLCFKYFKDYEKALEYYNKALQISPDSAVMYSNIGNLYIDMKEYDKALTNLNIAVELNIEESYIPYYNRGNCYYYMEKYNEAFEDYNKSIAIEPNFEEHYYNRGLCYEKMGDTEKAILDYTKTISLNPDYFLAYHNRARLYFSMSNYVMAVPDCKKVLELNPDYDLIYCDLCIAEANFYKDNIDVALEYYQKAIELNPENIDLYYQNIGICYTKIKDYEKALYYLNYAIKMGKNKLLAYYYKGFCDLQFGKIKDAIFDFTKVIGICETDLNIKNENSDIYVDSIVNRGLCYTDAKEFQSAANDFKKFIECEGKHDDLFFSYGICLHALGKDDEASEYIIKAADLYTDLINQGEDCYFRRGNCFMCLEKFKEALSDFNKAVELHPDIKEVVECRNDCIKFINENCN